MDVQALVKIVSLFLYYFSGERGLVGVGIYRRP